MLIPILAFTAAWTPDDRARELAADMRAALDLWLSEIGQGWKYAADAMGTSVSELSAWLSCRKPLNAFRFAVLPDAFQDHLLAVRAKRIGGVFLSADIVILLKGASVLRRSLVKARLKPAQKVRTA